jgi:cell wall-associated NlpC family hydrolase
MSMTRPDPRVTLLRSDLGSAALEGVVTAQHYAETRPMQVTTPTAAVRIGPSAGAEQVDQLLFGETFQVLEAADGWAWGQADRDGYVGYAELRYLTPEVIRPTHWVGTIRTYAFCEPSIRAPVAGLYSLNALVTVEAEADERFAKVARLGYMAQHHLSPIGDHLADDPAGVAERYLGAPYLWGGRDSLGLDCSGLIQQALYACGRACPRDSDLQQELGASLDIAADLGGLQRNDLVFWKGHVGIMLDAERLLHANAHHMAAAIEPLAVAVTRIEAAGSGRPTAFRRL